MTDQAPPQGSLPSLPPRDQAYAEALERMSRMQGRIDQLQGMNLNLEQQRLQAVNEHSADVQRRGDPGLRNFRAKAPSPFSGGRADGQSVQAWIFSTTSYVESCAFTTEAAKLGVIPTLLTGDASIWWMYVSRGDADLPVPETWKAFTTALQHQFEPVNAKDKARGQFLILRQTGTVSDYVSAWRALSLQLNDISEEDKRFRFINGLADHIQIAVNSQAIADLQQTIINAERLDHYHGLRKNHLTSAGTLLSASRSQPPADSSGPTTSTAGPQPMELGSMEEWADYSYDERMLCLDHGDFDTIAAILARPRGMLQRTGKAPYGPGNPLPGPLRARAMENNLCFRCLSSEHAVRDCKVSASPKGPSSSA